MRPCLSLVVSFLVAGNVALAFPTSPAGMPASSDIIAHAQKSPSDGICCGALSYVLGKLVSYPLGAAYANSLSTYWSLQETSVTPKCVVEPESTSDVSKAVFVLSLLSNVTGFSSECHFAIKSGGHTPWAGAANQQGGVTIDLAKLNGVKVSTDKKLTGIGPGNRWVDVYSKLDSLGLAIPGGRVSDVGVGGLVTGGGISFFSPQFGFVCDSVVNYEVVLPYGKTVNANASSYPDLYKSLKGGSNNFGAVTRFDVKTFQQGPFWGGQIGYNIEARQKIFAAFAQFNSAKPFDEYAALINNCAFIPGAGWIIVNNYEYTKQPAQPYPPTFQPFTSIQPQLLNTMRVAPMTSFTTELSAASPQGLRETFITLTIQNDAPLMSQIFDIANSTLQSIPPTFKTYSISFQPLPAAILAKGAGKNSLGLSADEAPLTNILFGIQWVDIADDARIAAAGKDFFHRATQAAKVAGKWNEYIYLNYAEKWQDPIAGYGAAEQARLREISRKYDQDGIFQKAVPGGFKLF